MKILKQEQNNDYENNWFNLTCGTAPDGQE